MFNDFDMSFIVKKAKEILLKVKDDNGDFDTSNLTKVASSVLRPLDLNIDQVHRISEAVNHTIFRKKHASGSKYVEFDVLVPTQLYDSIKGEANSTIRAGSFDNSTLTNHDSSMAKVASEKKVTPDSPGESKITLKGKLSTLADKQKTFTKEASDVNYNFDIQSLRSKVNKSKRQNSDIKTYRKKLASAAIKQSDVNTLPTINLKEKSPMQKTASELYQEKTKLKGDIIHGQDCLHNHLYSFTYNMGIGENDKLLKKFAAWQGKENYKKEEYDFKGALSLLTKQANYKGDLQYNTVDYDEDDDILFFKKVARDLKSLKDNKIKLSKFKN